MWDKVSVRDGSNSSAVSQPSPINDMSDISIVMEVCFYFTMLGDSVLVITDVCYICVLCINFVLNYICSYLSYMYS